jgi:hypothetical protein
VRSVFFECLPLEPSYNCEKEGEDSDISEASERTEKVAEKGLQASKSSSELEIVPLAPESESVEVWSDGPRNGRAEKRVGAS